MKRSRFLVMAGLLVAALTVAACSSGSVPAPMVQADVDEARATEIATNALDALNRGDYAAWSRDWNDAMKAAIKEADFQAFRASVLEGLGRYVEIKGADYGSYSPGTYRWTFTIAFEKGEGKLGFAFNAGDPRVGGLHTS
ncbi:MAG TPA: DUF3887 domain-containing protein [Candidatus Limnocylindrales bacterium]|nr:DUF3887 domain-containing protein [Candidatus Limnocylindrales bacterium]